MTSTTTSIVWFRQDLRLHDNPALEFASSVGKVLPIYILDEKNGSDWRPGKASRWWLNGSLQSLDRSMNGALRVFRGDPLKIIEKLITEYNIRNIFWNRCYEPWQALRDKVIKSKVQKIGVNARSFNGSLLYEPWEVVKSDGSPYKVFTPFYKQSRLRGAPKEASTEYLRNLQFLSSSQKNTEVDSLNLLGENDWSNKLASRWIPGETGGEQTLKLFLDGGIRHYKVGRDFPAKEAVSKLSPYLHFGELSPNHVWHAVNNFAALENLEVQAEHFHRELVWREFSYSLLHHFPDLTFRNFNNRFDDFPWQKNTQILEKWQNAETGYPLIDAGMRELASTGYMHNRIRMVTASFLVKNLLIDWRNGADWFWESLVDADLANNYCSWQWVAGSGADAAPYFRIFNPVTQSKKFDPDAKYIKRWIPELEKCPSKYIHDPSSAPESELRYFGIKLDQSYPSAIVDLKTTREAALSAYQSLKDKS